MLFHPLENMRREVVQLRGNLTIEYLDKFGNVTFHTAKQNVAVTLAENGLEILVRVMDSPDL